MGRPIKNNADYFTHDADMRNDAKVKAIRRKFDLAGYAVYCMVIEFITDSDFFQFKNDAVNIEIIAGDFDCDPDLLTSVLQYCIQLDLFQMTETGYVKCKTLENRMQALLSKRKRDRFDIIADDNTQSKVKESKVKNSTEKQSAESAGDKNSFEEVTEQKTALNPVVDLEKKLTVALDELYIDQEKLKWKEIDFDFELTAFQNKVRGSPDHYRNHDTGGIRLALQSQLRNAKPKKHAANKGTSTGISTQAGGRDYSERL
jgi:hypothetical protein